MNSQKPMYILVLLLIFITTHSTMASSLSVTVTTNKSNYVSMDNVNVHGNLTFNGEPAKKGLVGIQVEPYGASPFVMRTVPTGNFASDWRVEILSVQPCDRDGNPKQNFKREKSSYFKVEVKNNEIWENTVLITVNAYDISPIPLGLVTTRLIVSGESTVTFLGDIWIPEWACVGNAPVYANVYTDWPQIGGHPYAPEKMGNFTIIESEGAEPPKNAIPEQPIHDGFYEIEFCLGPEPFNATYFVNVCAHYQGYIASNSISFLVNSINVHNVAVERIDPDAVYNNWTADIAVTVKNRGTMLESFDLSVYVNDSLIGFENIISLEKNQQETLTFNWDTTGIPILTNMTIRANVTIIPEEINTIDNELTDTITVKLLGDVVFDRLIDISDMVSVTRVYRSKEGDPSWDPEVDLIQDGVIDISDVVTVTRIYRYTY